MKQLESQGVATLKPAATATASAAPAATEAATKTTATKTCLARFLVAHEIEAIDEVHHHIAVDGIRPGIAAIRGTVVAVDAGALTQDVVPLHAYRGILRLEEVLAELCIPDELVGVHACIIVATTALLRNVAAELHVPRHIDDYIATVVVEPCIAIALLLHIVAGVLIVHAGVDSDLKEVVTEVETQIVANTRAARIGLLQEIVFIHVSEQTAHVDSGRKVLSSTFIEVGTDITHIVAVVEVEVHIEVEILLRSQSRVEAHPCACVPPSIDIHRTAVADARCSVVDGGIAYGTAVHVGIGIDVPTHLFFRDVIVVVDIEAVIPRALQACITRADVERIAVVHHLDEVGHRRLRHIAVVADTQLAVVRNLPSQIEARRPVLDVTNGVYVDTAFVVLHICALGLPVQTHIEVQLLAVLVLAAVAQHEVDSLVELLVGGILAVHGIARELRKVDAVVDEVHAIIGAVVEVGSGNVGETPFLQRLFQLVIDHHLAITVLEAVLPLITELHDSPLQDGFSIADTSLGTIVLGGRRGVLVVGIQFATTLIVLDDRTAE